MRMKLIIAAALLFAGVHTTQALPTITVPHTFAQFDTVRASHFNANFDSIRVPLNAFFNDTLDAEFVRFSDLTSGDTLLDSLRVVALVSGRTYIDTINEKTAAHGVLIDGVLAKDAGITASGTVDFSGATVSDGGAVTTVDINGGTIDGATVGATSASTGAFTTLSTTGNATLGDASGDAHTVNGTMTIDPGTQAYEIKNRSTALVIQSQNAGTRSRLDLFAKDGDGTDEISIALWGLGAPDDISNIESLLLRASSNGTNIEAFDIYTANNGSGSLRPLILGTGAAGTNQIYLATDGDVGIGTASPSYKLDVDGGFRATGTSTFAGATISDLGTVTTADINGGTIDGATVGATSASTGAFTTLSASTSADFSGATISDLGTVTTADINGGTVDGATVGANSASTGAFTTLSADSISTAGDEAFTYSVDSATCTLSVSGGFTTDLDTIGTARLTTMGRMRSLSIYGFDADFASASYLFSIKIDDNSDLATAINDGVTFPFTAIKIAHLVGGTTGIVVNTDTVATAEADIITQIASPPNNDLLNVKTITSSSITTLDVMTQVQEAWTFTHTWTY